MPRPATETAEQTVSAIIRSSRQGSVERAVRPFHPAPSPTPGATPRANLRDISGMPSSPGPGWSAPFRDWETGPMNDSPVSSTQRPAPVVLDVWCELQCADCRDALADLRALRARYGDRLELRLRHFPLEKHRHAFAA